MKKSTICHMELGEKEVSVLKEVFKCLEVADMKYFKSAVKLYLKLYFK